MQKFLRSFVQKANLLSLFIICSSATAFPLSLQELILLLGNFYSFDKLLELTMYKKRNLTYRIALDYLERECLCSSAHPEKNYVKALIYVNTTPFHNRNL
jgi:hypothetical protein